MTVSFGKLLLDILWQDLFERSAGSIFMRFLKVAIVIVVLFGIFCLLKMNEKLLERYANVGLSIFAVVFGVIQIGIGSYLRVNPMYDFSAVYHGAVEWVVKGSFSRFYDYYYYYPNNLGEMTLLMFVFQIAAKLGYHDFYFVGILVNCVLNALMVVLTFLVLKKRFSVSEAIFSLVLYAIYPPMYLLGAVFYTDEITMVFPILLYALCLCMEKEKKNYKICIYGAALALAGFMGYVLKPTIAIMLIAIAIFFVLLKRWKQLLIFGGCFFVVFISLNFVFHSYIYPEHLDEQKAEQLNTPLETWVFMGLNENVGFSPEDTEFSREIEDPLERKEILRKEILKRVDDYGKGGLFKHIRNKCVTAFADGTFELSYTFLCGFQNDTDLKEIVTLLGKHYGIYWELCTSIWYSYLIFAVLFGVIVLFKKHGNINYEDRTFPVALAVFGLLCFLALWEVHPRYIVNYFSCFVFLAVRGISLLYEKCNTNLIRKETNINAAKGIK